MSNGLVQILDGNTFVVSDSNGDIEASLTRATRQVHIQARVIEVDPNLPGTERAPRPIKTAMMLRIPPFRAPNAAIFVAADMKATTGVGAP